MPETSDSSLPPEANELFNTLYDELKGIARTLMAKQSGKQTLQPTALINEAFIRLEQKQDKEKGWISHEHFLRTAATVMRRVLIDHARGKARIKRGGKTEPIELTGLETSEVSVDDNLLAVHDALLELEKSNPEKAELVSLRFFAGLTIDEAANVLSISRTTAKQWWQFSKAWLHHELSK